MNDFTEDVNNYSKILSLDHLEQDAQIGDNYPQLASYTFPFGRLTTLLSDCCVVHAPSRHPNYYIKVYRKDCACCIPTVFPGTSDLAITY